MKKVMIHRPGGYDRLQLEEHPDLTAGPGEVLIAVSAIGVNYADCVTRMGLYASAKAYVGYPITPGFEAAGTVAGTGEGVNDLAVGTKVLALTLFDGYASQLVLDRRQVFPIPKTLSLVEAAGFPTAFLTAYAALFELAHARSEETVLVHSAAGGVGGALVQLGKLANCTVVGVVGAHHKVGVVKGLGADAVIDKSSQNLWAQAESLEPSGFDIVLDANGLTTLRGSYEHLRPLGRLVIYGFHGMLPKRGGRPNWMKLGWAYLRTPRFNPLRLTTENRSVLGLNLSFLSERTSLLIPAMKRLLQWQDEGEIRVPRVTTYPFGAVARAHRDLESGQTVGKLVLTVD